MLECPHCKGLLYKDDDGFEKYLTCIACGRPYDFDLRLLALEAEEWEIRYKLNLTSGRERARIEGE